MSAELGLWALGVATGGLATAWGLAVLTLLRLNSRSSDKDGQP